MKSAVSHTALLPLVLALVGCGFNQVKAQNSTPIPQSLIIAAERASNSSMALADIMARSHGQSVRDIELELPDVHVPDFLLQRVRLDYNGPMEQVLERVSHDIGYRVVEYNEPSAGRSWEPWIRLDGDKPLIQHFKEMNSQTPWHLVLDHRSNRIVLDYDEDGSIARQVESAQKSLNERSAVKGVTHLPDSSSIQEDANRQVSNNVIPAPESSASQATTRSEPRSTASPGKVNDDGSYWYTRIAGYNSNQRALDMKTWLASHDYTSMVVENSEGFEVRVPAASDTQANANRVELEKLGVPTSVFYHAESGRASSTAKAPMPVTPTSYQEQADSVPTGDLVSSDELIASKWYVQIAYTVSKSGAGNLAKNESIMAHPVNGYKMGSGWALRMGPFDSRSEAVKLMRVARDNGYADAYPVQGSAA